MENNLNLKPFKHLYNSLCSFKAVTKNGGVENEDYLYLDVRESICDFHKDNALELLNDEEKEMFLKTIYIEMKEHWGLEKKLPLSNIYFLTNSNPDFLIEQKKLLLNQLKDLEIIISMNTKLEKLFDRELYSIDQDDSENWD